VSCIERSVGNVEAHAREDLLDALHRAHDRMQATRLAHASRQRDVERLGLELRFEFFIGKRLAPRVQGRLDRLLGLVDGRAAGLLFFDRQRAHALHQLGDAAGLAGELRLGIFKVGRSGCPGERIACAGDDCFDVFHGEQKCGQQKKTGLAPAALALFLDVAPGALRHPS